MESRVEFNRSWKAWGLAVEEKRVRPADAAAEYPAGSDKLIAKIHFQQAAQWKFEGGTIFEESSKAEASRTLFFKPTWKDAQGNLNFGLKLDYGTDQRLGALRGDGFTSKTTVRWKACEKGCGRTLAFDLSWREVEDTVTSRRQTERKASLKVEYRL